MKMTTLLFAVLFFLVGCGSGPAEVAITQTGNPSIVTLGVSVGDAPTTSTTRSAVEATDETDSESTDETDSETTDETDSETTDETDSETTDETDVEEEEITSLTITSAELMVAAVILTGPDTTVEFRKIPPYLVNVALDSSRVVLDSLLVPTGTVFDSMTLIIAPDESSNQLSGNSILIKGYVNGNSARTFEFPSQLSIPKRVALTKPLTVSETLPNRVTVKLAVNHWFLDSDGEYIDPDDDEFKEDIEDSILEAIYGEEDHDDEDDEEEEEESDSEEVPNEK